MPELGEYAKLAQFAGTLINFHLHDHANQLRTTRQQIDA